MNKANVTQEGGCHCGQARIKMTAPPFPTVSRGVQESSQYTSSLPKESPSRTPRVDGHSSDLSAPFGR